MSFGWLALFFAGSNGWTYPIPHGYGSPEPNKNGMQAWVEVVYESNGKTIGVVPAHVLGNFLCDGLAVAHVPPNGRDVMDLGDVLN